MGSSLLKNLTVVIACALALSSCAAAKQPGEQIGGSYGNESPLKTKKAKPPKDVTSTKPAQGVPKGKGSFSVRVTSPTGIGLSGLFIEYTGPQNGKATTNADGVATATVKPGGYSLNIAECGTTLHIPENAGGGAALTVAAGSVTEGKITNIGWEPRYQPIGVVRASSPPPWASGSTFTLRTKVGDACNTPTKAVSRSVAVHDWEYTTSRPMKLQGKASMTSDAKGWLSATFLCDGAGDGDIAIRDPSVGTRYVSLLRVVPPPSNSTYCT